MALTKENFNKIWNITYPETIPISHLFKQRYSERCLRIHSLPESKRYAENIEEWNVLLKRQNQIINDIFTEGIQVFIVTGEYNWGEQAAFVTDEEEVFKLYNFVRLDNISLFEINADDYEEGTIYRPAFAETIWNLNKHDILLKAIAKDEIRAFFVSFEKNVIIAPYDGGIDFVFSNNQTKENYRKKYEKWLSEREDGL